MVCFIALRSFKTQTHITIKLAAWKRCNNVLHNADAFTAFNNIIQSILHFLQVQRTEKKCDANENKGQSGKDSRCNNKINNHDCVLERRLLFLQSFELLSFFVSTPPPLISFANRAM
jgi:hypothetical protein